jgi:hypothetical protein
MWLNTHRQREPERRTLSQTRFDPDPPPVHLDNAFDYGQPEASPTLEAGAGTVGLLELVKDRLLIRLGNASARVRDGHGEVPVRHGYLYLHLASIGEFNGVPHQIEEHLRQAPLVSLAAWQIRGKSNCER